MLTKRLSAVNQKGGGCSVRLIETAFVVLLVFRT